MTVGQIPAPAVPAPVASAPRPRRLSTTPARLTVQMVVLALLAALFGLAAVLGTVARQASIGSVRATSGPLVIQAEQLYGAMSDADATAAIAFLSSADEPADLRTRYLQDIATAGSLVATVGGHAADTDALRTIAAGLPVYAGLIDTARADNRLGLPVGAAYLREASAYMRNTLLAAARDLFNAEIKALHDDRSGGAAFGWFAVLLGVLALAAAIAFQRGLSRRTRRTFNAGLVAATLALVAALGWLVGSWGQVHSRLHTSEVKGSAPVQYLATARINLLRARTDEALTLIARGNGAADQADYASSIKQVTAALNDAVHKTQTDSIPLITSDLDKWTRVHATIRKDDDGGDYDDAVALAIGSDPGNATAAFNAVDQDLDNRLKTANQQFTTAAEDAWNGDRSVGGGIGILSGLAVVAIIFGYWRRIAEYR